MDVLRTEAEQELCETEDSRGEEKREAAKAILVGTMLLSIILFGLNALFAISASEYLGWCYMLQCIVFVSCQSVDSYVLYLQVAKQHVTTQQGSN